MITINMQKARDIQRQALREERKPLLADLDIQYSRAIEANDVELQAQIIVQKQALRDAPKSALIDQASNVDELKAVTLEVVTTKP